MILEGFELTDFEPIDITSKSSNYGEGMHINLNFDSIFYKIRNSHTHCYLMNNSSFEGFND